MGFLKPKPQTSVSENKNMAKINEAYSPSIATGNNSTNFLGQLLGVNNGGSADDAWTNYKDKAGYAPALSAITSGVTQGGAAQGLLNSGATSKALIKKGGELDSGMFNNFLQQLSGLSGIGLQGGGLVANAGQSSTGTGAQPSTAGAIASTIGGLASIFSDPKTKKDITKIDSFTDGLGLYTFRYRHEPESSELRVGVMADEIAALRPWALGPVVGGFQTVNYGAL